MRNPINNATKRRVSAGIRGLYELVILSKQIECAMNFRGERDFTLENQRYQQVVEYLVYILNTYPQLYYKILDQRPQLEYEVEFCRKKARYARQYLSRLIIQVKEYNNQIKVNVPELRLLNELVPKLRLKVNGE